jgi:glycosyltransferase involved in cell wall biosynthesis
MSNVHITVTSSARNARALAAKCVRSVREQTHRDFAHVFIDAASTDETLEAARHAAGYDRRFDIRSAPKELNALENLLPIWRSLPPDEVVVWLDGDDALAVDKALALVADVHAAGAWATYGQFITTDGEMGFAGQVGDNPRAEPWRATHLKSFRAGLVQATPPEYFQLKGGAWDQAVMLAALELAAERAVFIPRVLYLYSIEHSAEVNWTAEQKRAEHADVFRIRSMPRLERLERLPS